MVVNARSLDDLSLHLPLLNSWKAGIKRLGFHLVKHRVIPYAKNSHGFAFKTADLDVNSEEQKSESVNLWTHQDFNINSDCNDENDKHCD